MHGLRDWLNKRVADSRCLLGRSNCFNLLFFYFNPILSCFGTYLFEGPRRDLTSTGNSNVHLRMPLHSCRLVGLIRTLRFFVWLFQHFKFFSIRDSRDLVCIFRKTMNWSDEVSCPLVESRPSCVELSQSGLLSFLCTFEGSNYLLFCWLVANFFTTGIPV